MNKNKNNHYKMTVLSSRSVSLLSIRDSQQRICKKILHGILLFIFVQTTTMVTSSLTVDAMALFSTKTSTPRYFTHEGILPPLSLAMIPSNSTTLPYSVSEQSVVPVTYTNNPKTVYKWLSENLNPAGGILGFDIESVPHNNYFYKGGSIKSPYNRRSSSNSATADDPFKHAATVQLATTNSCLVVHLVRNTGRFSHACAPILKAILSDDRYIKVGCALDEDMISLYRAWGYLEATSRLDLGLIGIPTRKKNNNNNPQASNRKTRHGLQMLCRRLLNIELPKPKEVILSDWSRVPLTEEQIIYCARDAWAGAAVAQTLADSSYSSSLSNNPTSSYSSSSSSSPPSSSSVNIFHPSLLMRILPKREPTIESLVKRQDRRAKAKQELTRLLKPFANKNKASSLPEQVHQKAQNLRGVIKQRIIEPQLTFETDHLNIDL